MQEKNKGISLGQSIVTAVASARDVDPFDLNPPLGEVVDPDALDALFAGRPETTGTVTFDYAGHAVQVHSDGRVDVGDADDC